MARKNFKFEKRQKELAKQKKAEEKRLMKLGQLDKTAEADSEPVKEEVISEADKLAQWLSK